MESNLNVIFLGCYLKYISIFMFSPQLELQMQVKWSLGEKIKWSKQENSCVLHFKLWEGASSKAKGKLWSHHHVEMRAYICSLKIFMWSLYLHQWRVKILQYEHRTSNNSVIYWTETLSLSLPSRNTQIKVNCFRNGNSQLEVKSKCKTMIMLYTLRSLLTSVL